MKYFTTLKFYCTAFASVLSGLASGAVRPSSPCFCLHSGDRETTVSLEGRGDMGEVLDSVRAAIHERDADASNGTQPRNLRRRKRFLSYPRYVELMVTADAKMARHHGRNLEHYILTIMSVVSKNVSQNYYVKSSRLSWERGLFAGLLWGCEKGYVILRSLGNPVLLVS